MEYIKSIEKCRSLDELFNIWKNKEPEGKFNHIEKTFIADGIVNESVWANSKKKILFVLKEAYGTDWNENTLATWLRDSYPNRRIWNRIARLNYGLQNTSVSTIMRYKANLSASEHKESLNQIAVLNLKKSNGNSNSDYGDVSDYAEYDRIEIKREIELINPDIVVCGSTFKTLYNVVYEQDFDALNHSDNWYYYLNLDGKERLYIDYYHPAVHWSDLLVYYGLIGIYQQALIEKSNKKQNNNGL